MKTLVDANKDLVKMSTEKVKDESKGVATIDQNGVTNNNVFVGSTAELQKLVKDLRNSEE
jgi:hypothetical protein